MSDEEEDNLIVGRFRHNPVSDDKTPCIEVLMDTASGRGKDDLLLLKEVGSETRQAYKDKSYNREGVDRNQAVDRLSKLSDEVDDDDLAESLESIRNLLLTELEEDVR